MLDAPEFERWRDAADEARTAARVQAGAGGYNWACFLAEQPAQLLLKGLLHGIGAGAWGHDLVKLGREVATTTGAELPSVVAAALRRLSRHYIPARYPDAHPSGAPGMYYGASDAEQALADLETVWSTAQARWSALAAEADHERG